MHDIFDVDRLAALEDEAAWKEAYEQEMSKLDASFGKLTLIQYEKMLRNAESSELEEIERKHHQIFADPRLMSMLDRWQQQLDDPIWKRRLQVLRGTAMEAEIENHPTIAPLKNELMAQIMSKTFEYRGETYPFSTFQTHLMTNPDRDLRKALVEMAGKYAREVEPAFRKLLKARNQLAQQKGYANYFLYCFELLKGLDFQQYHQQCTRMMEQTEPVFREWEKRFCEKFGWDQTGFSDILYASLHCLERETSLFPSEKTIDALRFTCGHFGYDLDRLPIQVEIANLPYGGMMNLISTDEIRIALKKRDGHSGYAVALHEMGHALYEYFSFGQHAELVRFKNILGSEAMAEIFMTIASQKEWLVDCMGADASSLDQLLESEHLMSLMLTKYYYYTSLVEKAIYEDPDGDFQHTADSLFEQVFGLKGQSMNPAMDILFIMYPVYVQDYIYADGVRDMIRHAFGVKGLYGHQDVFEAIRKVFMEPSESKTWQEKVEDLCGEPFTFRYFEQFLANKGVLV